jgi:Ribbon-helix-helix protein, copG family
LARKPVSYVLQMRHTHYVRFQKRLLMPRAIQRKEHLLSMRLPENDIAIIDRAAALRGRSRTDFVRDAAHTVATPAEYTDRPAA